MSSSRPESQISPDDGTEDVVPAITDQHQRLPIEDAPSNGLQLANGNVSRGSDQRVQPANPPRALPVTPQPYANMSPLQDAPQDRVARV